MTRNRPGRKPPLGIIIGHARLPHALRRAAISIVPVRQVLFVVSNGDRPAHEIDRDVRQVAESHPGHPILVFADMYGSSCAHAGIRLKRFRAGVRMVCGVNVPMLVRFLQYRREKTLSELVRLMRRTCREEARRG